MIPRRRGTVKMFNEEKGYGFIGPDQGGADLFVHYTGIEKGVGGFKTLHVGKVVEFDTVPTEKGLACTNVREI